MRRHLRTTTAAVLDAAVVVSHLRYAVLVAFQIIVISKLSTTTISIFVPCDALRMINLDAPQMALQGDTIQLSCFYSLIADAYDDSGGDDDGHSKRQNSAVNTLYDLDEEPGGSTANADGRSSTHGRHRKPAATQAAAWSKSSSHERLSPPRPQHKDGPGGAQPELLYAIKWYKDEREFFRFVSQDWPHKQALPMDSLNIDVDKSDNQTVVLRNVSLKTSGSFRCEVSTDAPSFLTKSIERKVLIYSLPTEGPIIELANTSASPHQLQYQLGDKVELTCVSHESKPHVQLYWILNEQINLTSAKLHSLNLSSQLDFDVETKFLVRTPRLQSTEPPSSPSQVTPYALEQTADRRVSDHQMAGRAHKESSALLSIMTNSLNVDNLDQRLEITMSSLNFTVDANLIRVLSELSSSGEQKSGAADQSWRTRKASYVQAGGSQVNKHTDHTGHSSSRGTPATKKVSQLATAEAAAASQKRSTSPTKLPLRIRCVARVMHLKQMSNDIKLTLVNRTRGSPTTMTTTNSRQDIALTRESLKLIEIDGNSAIGLHKFDIFQSWLIIAISTVGWAFLTNWHSHTQ